MTITASNVLTVIDTDFFYCLSYNIGYLLTDSKIENSTIINKFLADQSDFPNVNFQPIYKLVKFTNDNSDSKITTVALCYDTTVEKLSVGELLQTNFPKNRKSFGLNDCEKRLIESYKRKSDHTCLTNGNLTFFVNNEFYEQIPEQKYDSIRHYRVPFLGTMSSYIAYDIKQYLSDNLDENVLAINKIIENEIVLPEKDSLNFYALIIFKIIGDDSCEFENVAFCYNRSKPISDSEKEFIDIRKRDSNYWTMTKGDKTVLINKKFCRYFC